MRVGINFQNKQSISGINPNSTFQDRMNIFMSEKKKHQIQDNCQTTKSRKRHNKTKRTKQITVTPRATRDDQTNLPILLERVRSDMGSTSHLRDRVPLFFTVGPSSSRTIGPQEERPRESTHHKDPIPLFRVRVVLSSIERSTYSDEKRHTKTWKE